MRSLRCLLLLFVFIPVCWPSVCAQSRPEEYWQPIEHTQISLDRNDPQVRTLLSRWSEIGEDLKTNSNPFAGTYEMLGYVGYFLRWSPDKGFIYVFHSEGLSIIDFSYGQVRVTPTEILFVAEREMKETWRGQKLKTPTAWILIAAGMNYLVPEEEINGFADYVAGFGNYNDFNGPCCEFSPFFFAPNSELAKATRPRSIVLPTAYQHFIKNPIRAEIVSVAKRRVVRNYQLEGRTYGQLLMKASLTPVSISAGLQNGVRKKMLFRIIGEPDGLYLKITGVGNRRSRGVVIQPGPKPYAAIHAGTKVTTSPLVDN